MKEFDVCDASGNVHVNIFTKFASSGGDADGGGIFVLVHDCIAWSRVFRDFETLFSKTLNYFTLHYI